MKPTVPHLTWPLRVVAGHLDCIEQDTLRDVTQCVHVLLRTPRGARVLLDDFGVTDTAWTYGVDLDEVNAQVAAYEERASVDVDLDYIDPRSGEQTTRLIVDLA
jgi:phage baseplate assembly protein W